MCLFGNMHVHFFASIRCFVLENAQILPNSLNLRRFARGPEANRKR
jgi:hypothetical protein